MIQHDEFWFKGNAIPWFKRIILHNHVQGKHTEFNHYQPMIQHDDLVYECLKKTYYCKSTIQSDELAKAFSKKTYQFEPVQVHDLKWCVCLAVLKEIVALQVHDSKQLFRKKDLQANVPCLTIAAPWFKVMIAYVNPKGTRINLQHYSCMIQRDEFAYEFSKNSASIWHHCRLMSQNYYFA